MVSLFFSIPMRTLAEEPGNGENYSTHHFYGCWLLRLLLLFFVVLCVCVCLNVRHAIRWIGPHVVRQCFPLHRLVLPFSYCNCTQDVVNVLSDFYSSHFTWRIASFFSSNFFFRFAVCDAIARKQLLWWKKRDEKIKKRMERKKKIHAANC